MSRSDPPQVIPRPRTWRPGADAPWTSVPPAQRTGIGIDRVLASLGALGQHGPVPADAGADRALRSTVLVNEANAPLVRRVNAAVLAVLFEEKGESRLVLTRRSSAMRTHRGEVSFPGGAAEPEDVDIAATALREAAEEVALDATAAGVQVVARLERFWIPVSDFEVHPVVAVAARRPELVASPAEVARIVEPRLDRFVPGAPIVIVERTIRDWPLRFGAYDIDGLTVWGATARILSQLGAAVSA